MNDLKKRFIEFTLDHEILRFGNFTLNSGRKSPYFFNTGLCCTGQLLNKLSGFYCAAIIENNIEFDYMPDCGTSNSLTDTIEPYSGLIIRSLLTPSMWSHRLLLHSKI